MTQNIHIVRINTQVGLVSAQNPLQSHFSLGRLCAIQALQKLGINNPESPLKNSDGSPAWPLHVVGSISHSHYVVGAVVGFKEYWLGIGLDLQVVGHRLSERLIEKICTRTEWNTISELSPQLTLHERFTLLFSAKETLFKCLYPMVQKKFWFSAATAMEVTDSTLYLQLTQTLHPLFKQGQEFKVFWWKNNQVIQTILVLESPLLAQPFFPDLHLIGE